MRTDPTKSVNRRPEIVGHSILAVLLAAMAGCAGEAVAPGAGVDSWTPGYSNQKVDDGNSPATPFQSDSRFVVLNRMDLAGHPDHLASRQEQPFSHRNKKWHVYPVTLYDASVLQVQLQVRDPQMADRAAVFVFGPMTAQGTWGEPVRGTTQDGLVAVEVESKGYGEYAIIVGPKSPDDFITRLPGRGAWLEPSDGSDDLYADFEYDQSGQIHLVTETGERYVVQDPLPGSAEDENNGEFLWIENSQGESDHFVILGWSLMSWWVPEDAIARGSGLFIVDQNRFDSDTITLAPVNALGEENSYQLLDTVGVNGEPDPVEPFIYRLVPVEHPDGRFIFVEEQSDCEEGSCRVAVFGDGTPISDDLIEVYKPLFFDLDESSQYDLDVVCLGNCGPVEETATRRSRSVRRPRYPIYFAHGFNSSKEGWAQLFEALEELDTEFTTWAAAESVSGHRPVPYRAEQLRQNLVEFLSRFEPLPGESFVRLNIIAHSMGGLDSRYLVGASQYNEECTPELCPTDTEGNPVPWKERIASITTLSTPHCGSSFADYLHQKITTGALSRWIKPGSLLRKFIVKVMGVDPADANSLEDTLYALSQTFCAETMGPHFPAPNPRRAYIWECATGNADCGSGLDADEYDLPVETTNGKYRLPAPDPVTTIFSWSSISCISGSCGSMLDPTLIWSHRRVNSDEGDNDGVVSLESATFGIHLGNRANDHYTWTFRSKINGIVNWVFGVEQEPVERFFLYWFAVLSTAGY